VGHPIEASGLVRRFGDLTAVDGVDLEVADGEIFGFLGPNGAGKSTTVRMLTTLLAPSAGSARVAGYDVVTEAGLVRRASCPAGSCSSSSPSSTASPARRPTSARSSSWSGWA